MFDDIEGYIENIFKFEHRARDYLLSEYRSLKNPRKIISKINNIRKPIQNRTIKLFFENPDNFFNEHYNLLFNTSFMDISGNSIFSHYFFILLENYKIKNNQKANINENVYNFNIYESNFDSFFKEYERYLIIQDFNLDTPLHKIARMKDKGFFIEIYKKLRRIEIINNEILLISNKKDENIFNYIFNEVKYNSSKIKNVEFYKNFINENNGIYESLFIQEKMDLKKYMANIIFDIKPYKKENFDEIYNNIFDFVNENIKDMELFPYIYTYYTHYLNSLFYICSKKDDYDKMFKLIFLLTTKYEIEDGKYIIKKCIIDHITNVLRKMNSYNSKGKYEVDYGTKLLKEILNKITKNTDEKIFIFQRFFDKSKKKNIVEVN